MFQTRVTEMLGIRYPVLMGTMQWLARAELVAAVAEAGGLGFISSASFDSTRALREEIRKAKSLTDKPIGVNINLFPTARPVNTEEYIATVIAEGIKVVETSGRSPEAHMKQMKDGGLKVIHKSPSVRFARTAERIGVDAVCVVGYECGGHPGLEDVTSLVLVPLTVDAVKIPVIAAGGFGDARGFVAALTLGAEGVLMGTRFMATKECPAHPRFKERLLEARETDTMIIERSIRNNSRALRNKVAEEVAVLEEKGATLEDLLPLISGLRSLKVYTNGDVDAGVIACGQVVGMVNSIHTVKEVMDEIIEGATAIVHRLDTLAGRVSPPPLRGRH